MYAVSKLVAVVILVGVALALSTGIALWLSGIVGGATRLERIDIIGAYPRIIIDKFNPDKPPVAVISIQIANRGSVDATIDRILVNSKPVESYGGEVNVSTPLPLTIRAGEEVVISLNLSTTGFSHGQMVTIEIHTASGGRYPTTVEIP